MRIGKDGWIVVGAQQRNQDDVALLDLDAIDLDVRGCDPRGGMGEALRGSPLVPVEDGLRVRFVGVAAEAAVGDDLACVGSVIGDRPLFCNLVR